MPPDCSRCVFDGQKNRRCITCPGPSEKTANHGQKIVSLDAMPESELAKLPVIPISSRESKFSDFFRLWLRMSPRSRDLLARAIVSQPRSNASIARKMVISRQAVSKHLLKIAMAHPELRTVLRLRMNRPKIGNNTKK